MTRRTVNCKAINDTANGTLQGYQLHGERYTLRLSMTRQRYTARLSSSSFGVHPLRMTTTSTSTFKVGLTVDEEANA